jgi:2-dehydropantoate 2-reductase
VVARGATLEALQLHGLRLQRTARRSSAPVRSSSSPAELGVQDLVVVAVKAPAMADVAKAIGPLLGPDTMVLTAMNGVPWWFFEGFGGPLAGTRLQAVDPDGASPPPSRAAHHRLRGARQLLARAPGFVKHHFGNKLIVGEPAGGRQRARARLAALLEKAGFEAVVSSRSRRTPGTSCGAT